jgi:hypothetical protein
MIKAGTCRNTFPEGCAIHNIHNTVSDFNSKNGLIIPKGQRNLGRFKMMGGFCSIPLTLVNRYNTGKDDV